MSVEKFRKLVLSPWSELLSIPGQSLEQKEIITELPKNKALYVEGAFRVWLRDKQVNYFILRGEPVPRPPPNTLDIDDVKKIKIWTLGQFDENDLVKIPNVHEQVGVCY